MTEKHSGQAEAGPGEQDPVLAALRHVEARYREIYIAFATRTDQNRREMAQARENNARLKREHATQQRELDQERLRSQRDHEVAERLAAAVGEIHRSLFGGNIYELILKTCLTLTGATRGL